MRAHIQKPLISLVVPFYNEGEAVERFFDSVVPIMDAIESIRFEIVCINDGSRDNTLDRLIAIGAKDTRAVSYTHLTLPTK